MKNVEEYLIYAKPFYVTKEVDNALSEYRHTTIYSFVIRDNEDTGLCSCDDKNVAELITNALNSFKTE